MSDVLTMLLYVTSVYIKWLIQYNLKLLQIMNELIEPNKVHVSLLWKTLAWNCKRNIKYFFWLK